MRKPEGLPERTMDQCGDAQDALPPIFVFGSNKAGRHGKGAALFARNERGAIYGIGEGRMGNSYALPTKGYHMETLSLEEIERRSVANFLSYARVHSDETFELTPVGCGLAGYTHAQIAPMFRRAPPNVRLPSEFMEALSPAPREAEASPRHVLPPIREESKP